MGLEPLDATNTFGRAGLPRSFLLVEEQKVTKAEERANQIRKIENTALEDIHVAAGRILANDPTLSEAQALSTLQKIIVRKFS